jgi:hypothetical protein
MYLLMLNFLRTTFSRSLRMFYTVARIMLPIMIVVRVAAQWGLIEQAGKLIGPIMGLPRPVLSGPRRHWPAFTLE